MSFLNSNIPQNLLYVSQQEHTNTWNTYNKQQQITWLNALKFFKSSKKVDEDYAIRATDKS